MWLNWGSHSRGEALYSYSDNGFVEREILYAYFEQFVQLVPERPCVIIFDSHISHLDPETILLAKRKGVAILKLPAHTTDTLQPLDKAVFKSLKEEWDKIVLDFQLKNQRKMTE